MFGGEVSQLFEPKTISFALATKKRSYPWDSVREKKKI